jgi:hypothetical protein
VTHIVQSMKRALALTLVAPLIAGIALIAGPVQAGDVPVSDVSVGRYNPGPIAADRPIWGTTQNLPRLDATSTFNAGPAMATPITAFYGSGQALKGQQNVTEAALAWIEDWTDRRCDGDPEACNATVVFDVDETLLDNYGYYAENDFLYDPATFPTWVASCESPANAPVRALFNTLKKQGYTLVIITGRAETQRSVTAACLKERGIKGWDQLILRPESLQNMTASQYKAIERKELRKSGLRIVASVGDQVSDMALGQLHSGWLLPNPMYLIP